MDITLDHLKGKKALIVGDVILDTYHMGEVKRISPEAPVPVVRVNYTYSVLGGAANVARNLLGLECSPQVVSTIGDDDNGKTMRRLFDEVGMKTELFHIPFPTITKTRVIGNKQQVVRLDFETEDEHPDSECEQKLIEAIRNTIPETDIVIISDYGKGLCTHRICQHTIRNAREQGKKTIVDPKGTDWEKYRGATIVTPNLKELSDVCGCRIKNEDQAIHAAAAGILQKYDLEALLVTRSEKGMSYITAESALDIPTEAKEVYDVSGAGDTAVATLAAALACGFPIWGAIHLANKAAGIVVGKLGTSSIRFEELLAALQAERSESKLISLPHLTEVVKQLRAQGHRILFTNGCFDILHKGHVQYLEQAKRMGGILVVGLNSDSSVRRLKGESRPVNDQTARATVLGALGCVDYVTIFSEDTPLELIRTLAPDLLIKGGDYAVEDIVGREYARKTIVLPFVQGYSTTQTIQALKQEE